MAPEPFDENIAPGSRRERKKAHTYRALRREALRLLHERGYGGFTIREVASGADVSERTFFNYFPTKDAVITGWDPERNGRLCDALLARPACEEPFAALRVVLLTEAEHMTVEFSALELTQAMSLSIVQAFRTDPHLLAASASNMASLEATLTTALCTRLGTDPAEDVFAHVLVAAALGALRTLITQCCLQGSPGAVVEVADLALRILESGFSHPVRREISLTPSGQNIPAIAVFGGGLSPRSPVAT